MKKKKLKAILIIIASFIVVVGITLTIVIASLYKDKNRSNYSKTDITYNYIIKKNYVRGFNSTALDGNFSFSLPNEDINELLSHGVKQLNDKYIENIYYDFKEDHHYFYVDLTKTLVKTRVVIDTVKSPLFEDGETYLVINRCTMGKVDAFNKLKKKGYLTSKWIDDFFNKCKLPVTYNEETLSFLVKPISLIDSFPSTSISDTFFSLFKENSRTLINSNNSLFGFNASFSKLVTDSDFSDIDTSTVPNLYNEIKSACEALNPGMYDFGDTMHAYSLSEDNLNKLLNKAIPETLEEQVKDGTNFVCFSLKGIKAQIATSDKINFNLYYSINGYLIRVDTELGFFDMSNTAKFNSLLEEKFTFKIKDFSFQTKQNKYVSFFINQLSSVLNNLAVLQSEIFAFNEEGFALYLDSKEMVDEFSNLSLKDSLKDVVINTVDKTIEFNVIKTA